MSGSNPIPIKRKYTNRTCLGPLCRGKRTFRSAGPQNRICQYCRDDIENGHTDGKGQHQPPLKNNIELAMGGIRAASTLWAGDGQSYAIPRIGGNQ